MTQHQCGCCLEPVTDADTPCDLCSEATGSENGTGWVIVRCPTHAAAPAMLDALREVAELYPHIVGHCHVVEKARAVLATIDALCPRCNEPVDGPRHRDTERPDYCGYVDVFIEDGDRWPDEPLEVERG